MLDDEVRIRQATAEDADELSDIAWQSKAYSEIDTCELNELRDILDIKPAMIENNIAYVAEDSETEEILGFYFVESCEEKYWLRYLCVAPDYMGTGIGEALFLSACEMAEEVGAEELQILCDENSEEFYTNMGAERCGGYILELNGKKHNFLRFRIALAAD